MLATSLGKVSESKLQQAIKANIECEAGLHGTPHPRLATKFAQA